MARADHRGVSLHAGLASALALGMVLGGCAMSLPGGGAQRAGSGVDMLTPTGRSVERDTEAPEVFSMEESGLWDGRPSLGGVWVAHPGAESPERVLIRNTQNGETVIGALFRRERDNPGPRFQVSSEAANALGILPGAPTTISVVALRLEQIEMEPSRPADDVAGTTGATADEPAQSGTPAGQVEIATLEGEDTPRRGFLSGLFGRGSSERAEEPGIAETALAPSEASEAALSEPAVAARPETQPQPQPQEQAQTQPRRGLLGIFSRRQPEPEPLSAMIPLPDDESPEATAALTATPTAATTVAPTAALAASTLDRPFVQIGIFSVESNATNARNQMQSAGLDAEIRRGRANDREFWRVVVGPARDTAARGQALERVRAMGFADAYAVVR
ncbi:MAG: SPOR domain-containing protein [Pararhodobacter sp.]|nr:SPOR domain-containing protein [Pararhodobacter sp.]